MHATGRSKLQMMRMSFRCWQLHLKATLTAIAQDHPQSRLDELLPWNFKPSSRTTSALLRTLTMRIVARRLNAGSERSRWQTFIPTGFHRWSDAGCVAPVWPTLLVGLHMLPGSVELLHHDPALSHEPMCCDIFAACECLLEVLVR